MDITMDINRSRSSTPNIFVGNNMRNSVAVQNHRAMNASPALAQNPSLRLSPRVKLDFEFELKKRPRPTSTPPIVGFRGRSHTPFVGNVLVNRLMVGQNVNEVETVGSNNHCRPIHASVLRDRPTCITSDGLNTSDTAIIESMLLSPDGTTSNTTDNYVKDTEDVIKDYQQRQFMSRPERQLHAYLAWVNSQLKKRAGTRLVDDLRHDMKDGVALINLVEIVGGEKLHGAHMCPSNLTEMKDNVEKVLQFMTANKIKMHHIVAKDIVEGNLKSVMRLILALAAHFKPKSVRQSGYGIRSPGKSTNVASIAQGAAAALADARRDVARAGSTRYRRRGTDKDRHERRIYRESSSDQCSDSDQSFSTNERLRPNPMGGDHRGDIEGASVDSSSSLGARSSPVAAGSPGGRKSPRTGAHASHIPVPVCRRGKGESTEKSHYEELIKEHESLDKQMRETKQELLTLQDLLLRGQLPDGEESSAKLLTEGSPTTEQVVILKSQLQQSTLFCEDIKEELSKSKNECLRLQGVKAGLQQRLTEQEKVLLQMKAELLRKGFDLQNLESERDEMQKLLQDKDKIISELKTSLSARDHRVEQLQSDLKYQLQEKEAITKNLKAQVHDLHSRLKTVGETEASLSARMATQDKMMAKLEGKILKTQIDGAGGSSRSPTRSALMANADELQVVRDSLQSLRCGFQGGDPHQHTIDTLEQSISTLIEKLHTAHGQGSTSVDGISKRQNFDSTGGVRRSPITSLPGYPISRLDDSSLNGQSGTKVLYFTERTVTPFMCTLPKKLGEITLADIKKLHDRSGRFRYHFKAQDPEFGTVKEEVSFDEDVIPGWEGKVVAWIEEDTDE